MSSKRSVPKLQTQDPEDAAKEKLQILCSVCFVSTKRRSPHPNFEFITCELCKKVCHRGCYDETITASYFLCDPCKNSEKSTSVACFFCQNDGLVKEIGSGRYAHPVCLLLYSKVDRVSYITLEFGVRDGQLHSKTRKQQCSICHKYSQYLEQCHDPRCGQKCHFYCCLLNSSENQQCWESLLQITKPSNSESNNQSEKHRKKVSCPSHAIYCYCHQNKQANFVLCEQCLRWYHYSCTKIPASELNDEQRLYFCTYCEEWDCKDMQDSNFQMKVYPKLHFYDFVRVLRAYQKTKNSKILGVIKRFPMKCSTEFCRDVAELCLESELQVLFQQMAVAPSMSSFKAILVDNRLVQYVMRQHKLRSKYQQHLKRQIRSQLTVEQFYHFVKEIPKRQLLMNNPLYKFIEFYQNSRNYSYNLQYILKYLLHKIKTADKSLEFYRHLMDIVGRIQQRCNMEDFKAETINEKSLLWFVNVRLNDSIKKQYLYTFQIIKQLQDMKKRGLDSNQSKMELHKMVDKMSLAGLSNQLYQLVTEQIHQYFIHLEALKYKEVKKIEDLKKSVLSRKEIPLQQYQQFRLRQSIYVQKLELEYFMIKTLKREFDKMILGQPEEKFVGKMKKFLDEEHANMCVKMYPEDIRKYRVFIKQYEKIEEVVLLIEKIELFQTVKRMEYIRKYAQHIQENKECKSIDINLIVDSLSRTQAIHSNLKALLKVIYTHWLKDITVEETQGRKLGAIVRCINYFKIESKNKYLLEKKEIEYRDWQKVYIKSMNYSNLGAFFEDTKQLKNLQHNIKQGQVKAPIGINIDHQLKLLNMLELWCVITEKLYTEFFNLKPFPERVKDMMQIVKESQYPTGIAPYEKLYKLNRDCIETEKKIDSLLSENMAIVQDIDVTKEVQIVSKKTNTQQVRQFLKSLAHSKINWADQIKMLENHLDYFHKNEMEADRVLITKDYSTLNELFRFFLCETPFHYPKFQQLRNTLRAQQCKSIPKTKKEFDKLMNWSGSEFKQLEEMCKNNILAHRQLQSLEEALIMKMIIGFPTLEQIQCIMSNLFPHDPKRLLIRGWINQFYKLQQKVRQLHSKSDPQKYQTSTLQNWLREYDRIPIRSQIKHIVFQRLKTYYSISYSLNQNSNLWLNSEEEVLSESQMGLLVEEVKAIRQSKLNMKQHQRIISDVERYQRLVEATPASHEQYIEYLKGCHTLGKRYETLRFIQSRASNFIQNNRHIHLCTKDQAKEYFDEWAILCSNPHGDIFSESMKNIQDVFKDEYSKQNLLVDLRNKEYLQGIKKDVQSGLMQLKEEKMEMESDDGDIEIEIVAETRLSRGNHDIQEEVIDSDSSSFAS